FGGLVGLVSSFFVKSIDYKQVLSSFVGMELFGLIIFLIGLVFVFSVVCNSGFFAFLFINRFGLSLFRTFCITVQVLVIAFVVFYLIYFPYKGSDGDTHLFWFILMSLAILGYGWIVAKIKAKETHQRAFIPALFFMVVMTAIEW